MMSDKIKELLAVLDMSENEQDDKLVRYCWHHRKESSILADYHRDSKSGYCEISLADLAFRLRDEGVEIDGGFLFSRGLINVCRKLYGKNKRGLNEFISWAAIGAHPIHWIIAALIAKELGKDADGKKD